MSLINTQVQPFKVNAFHNGKFIEVTEESLKGKWSVLIFMPAAFTFNCPTEIEDAANNYGEFQKAGAEVYIVTTDTHFSHKVWHETSPAVGKAQFPLIGDPTHQLTNAFGVHIPEEGLALRGTFVINPEGVIKTVEIHSNEIARDAFDVLVVGGGPAGAAAAIYAARKGIRTGVAAERFGGQVLDTMAIENFISVQETEGPKLARALEEHVRHYEVDIMNLQRASKLVPAKNTGELHEVQFESGGSLKAKTLILATGARWREMGVPGEQEYKAKGVCFCPHCDGPLFKGKRVAVIGGGNSGVEAAIDLAGIVAHVTLLEFDSKLRADAVLQRKLYSLPNVEVITSALTSEVKGDGQKVTGLVYKDRNSEEFKSIELEGIFVQIGLLPNTEWLKGSVELSPRGEIIVDARGETSLPGIFAAGDVTTVPYKQIVIAVGEGAKASLSAFDHLIRTSAPE
ncbi:alkyl hydroperoxide reductase subunit F [Pseudomonas aeruginosa]